MRIRNRIATDLASLIIGPGSRSSRRRLHMQQPLLEAFLCKARATSSSRAPQQWCISTTCPVGVARHTGQEARFTSPGSTCLDSVVHNMVLAHTPATWTTTTPIPGGATAEMLTHVLPAHSR